MVLPPAKSRREPGSAGDVSSSPPHRPRRSERSSTTPTRRSDTPGGRCGITFPRPSHPDSRAVHSSSHAAYEFLDDIRARDFLTQAKTYYARVLGIPVCPNDDQGDLELEAHDGVVMLTLDELKARIGMLEAGTVTGDVMCFVLQHVPVLTAAAERAWDLMRGRRR